MWKLHGLGGAEIGTEQGTSVVSGEGQVQQHCSQPQPHQWASNVDCWCLGVRPSHGLKIWNETMSLSRLSPELPNTALLCPCHSRHSHEDFMLTSPQKTFSSCFSPFLAFRTFRVEGWCKLNEGWWHRIIGRENNFFFPFHLCFPSQRSEIQCSKTWLCQAGCLGRTEGCAQQPG